MHAPAAAAPAAAPAPRTAPAPYAALALAAALLVAAPAAADPVSVRVEGTIQLLEDPGMLLPLGLEEGDPYALEYRYDDGLADELPGDESMATYVSLAGELRLSVDGVELVACPIGMSEALRVEIDDDVGGEDAYFVEKGIDCIPVLPSDATVELANFQLPDQSGTAVASDALPTAPPMLSAWDALDATVQAAGCPDGDPACDLSPGPGLEGFVLVGDVQTVPAPGAGAQQGAAAAALALLALRRARRRP